MNTNRVRVLWMGMLEASKVISDLNASEAEFRAAMDRYNQLDEELEEILKDSNKSLKTLLAM